MSPRIGLTVTLGMAPRTERPADKVRAAVRHAEAEGCKLSLDAVHGVERNETTGRWVPTGPHRPRRVSLAGAICMWLQPVHGSDAEEGAAAALDVEWDWLLGLLDGWDNDLQTTLLEGASRQRYLAGLRAGQLLFAELTRECGGCGERSYHLDACRACARALAGG